MGAAGLDGGRPLTVEEGGATGEVRARGWRLLSSLYLEGVTGSTLPAVEEIPGLAEHLSGQGAGDESGHGVGDGGGPEPGEVSGSFDPDEAAAEHHRLFGLQVFPWASVFLERDGVLGGPVSDSVGRAFSRASLPAPDPSEPPDHIGHELELLATLTERGDHAGIAELLEGHLLWWLPVFVHSLGRVAPPFWRVVGDLTLEAALDQAGADRGDTRPSEGAPPGALALPAGDPVAEEDEGLGRVARHLVTPARGGLFLSLADIRSLGRGRDLPGGFGKREQVMANLLRSAAGYGELAGVATGLERLVEDQLAFLQRVPEGFRSPWVERLDGGLRVLERLSRGGEGTTP